MYKRADEALDALLQYFMGNVKGLAITLGIDDAHIYRGRKGDITPTLKKALISSGNLLPPPKRCRLAADVSPELREAIRAEADRRGLTMGELIERMWDLWQWATTPPKTDATDTEAKVLLGAVSSPNDTPKP